MAVLSLAGSAEAAGPGRALAVVGWLGGALLGVVLLVATWAKAIDPVAFEQQIRTEGLEILLPARAIAWFALALEAGLGVALIANLRNRWVLIPATLLVLFFTFLTARTWWRAEQGLVDPAAACGCFGNLVERTPKEAFLQDLLLLGPGLALAWVARPGARRRLPLRAGLAGAAAAGAVVFSGLAPGLPLDDLATRLKPGTELAALCAGRDAERLCLTDLVPQLAAGRHLVVVADIRDAGFDALAAPMSAYALPRPETPLLVLADMTDEEQRALFWRLAPAFDFHETPAALLRPLHRRLPRSFLVEEGRVLETWSGLPPAVEAAARTAGAAPASR